MLLNSISVLYAAYVICHLQSVPQATMRLISGVQ